MHCCFWLSMIKSYHELAAEIMQSCDPFHKNYYTSASMLCAKLPFRKSSYFSNNTWSWMWLLSYICLINGDPLIHYVYCVMKCEFVPHRGGNTSLTLTANSIPNLTPNIAFLCLLPTAFCISRSLTLIKNRLIYI